MAAGLWKQQAGERTPAGDGQGVTTGANGHGAEPAADLDGGAGRPRAVPLASTRGLGERLFQAHAQRTFGGGAPSSGPATDDGQPQDEMLQFVIALDDRSLVKLGVFAGVTGGGPLPRRNQELAPLPRRKPAATTARPEPVVAAPPESCPSCHGRQLRVDEIDLDAGTSVRTCVACDHSFIAPI